MPKLFQTQVPLSAKLDLSTAPGQNYSSFLCLEQTFDCQPQPAESSEACKFDWSFQTNKCKHLTANLCNLSKMKKPLVMIVATRSLGLVATPS